MSVIKSCLDQTTQRASNHIGGKHHSHSDGEPTRSLGSFAQDYRKLAIYCLNILHAEMQLETIFHMQVYNLRCYFPLTVEELRI
jgi:exocyst complex component 4